MIDIKKYVLFFIYALILFAMYPILRYFYFLTLAPYTLESKFFVEMRVYWSAPILIVFGLILIVWYKGLIKISGYFSLSVGLLFLMIIGKAILEEAQVL